VVAMGGNEAFKKQIVACTVSPEKQAAIYVWALVLRNEGRVPI